MSDEILFATKIDDENIVMAAKAADGKFVLVCRTDGVDNGAKLTAEQAAALGLALLAVNLDAAAALSAVSDPNTMIGLAMRILEPHPSALAQHCGDERAMAALPPGVTH